MIYYTWPRLWRTLWDHQWNNKLSCRMEVPWHLCAFYLEHFRIPARHFWLLNSRRKSFAGLSAIPRISSYPDRSHDPSAMICRFLTLQLWLHWVLSKEDLRGSKPFIWSPSRGWSPRIKMSFYRPDLNWDRQTSWVKHGHPLPCSLQSFRVFLSRVPIDSSQC